MGGACRPSRWQCCLAATAAGTVLRVRTGPNQRQRGRNSIGTHAHLGQGGREVGVLLARRLPVARAGGELHRQRLVLFAAGSHRDVAEQGLQRRVALLLLRMERKREGKELGAGRQWVRTQGLMRFCSRAWAKEEENGANCRPWDRARRALAHFRLHPKIPQSKRRTLYPGVPVPSSSAPRSSSSWLPAAQPQAAHGGVEEAGHGPLQERRPEQ